jgi:hypothetical protein
LVCYGQDEGLNALVCCYIVQQQLLIIGFLLVKALISFDKLASEGLVISAFVHIQAVTILYSCLWPYQNNKPT